MITIPVNNRGRTVIGRLGENEHRCIAFRESAAVLQMYPSAVVTVLHRRPGDPEAYPVSNQYVTIDDGVVKWMVQSGDLSATGCGQCELVFTQGGIVAKTMIYQTEILPALDGAGEPPEPWASWVQEVTEAATAAEEAVEHYPKIVNGYWYVWDVEQEEFVNTGVHAETDVSGKADKADTVLDTTLSRGRKENTAIGTGSLAFGDDVEASGNYSHAEGVHTIASGVGSHAEGGYVSGLRPRGSGSVPENPTTAEGRYSHAEGYGSHATGDGAHAEGTGAYAEGAASHAQGLYTITDQDFSFVAGKYNKLYYPFDAWESGHSYAVNDCAVYNGIGYKCIQAHTSSSSNRPGLSASTEYWSDDVKSNTNLAMIVGNGSASARSNAYELGWDGTGKYAGDVYANGDKKLATVERVETAEGSAGANALKSEGYAVGTQNGDPVDSSSSYFENNAKYHADRAATEAGKIMGMTAQATTLQPGSQATASYSNGVLAIGVPAGADGTDGTDGEDGVSPTITVTDITGGHRVTITDATGAHSFDVMDGQGGGNVSDVQINGTSIVENGVANVPVAGNGRNGVVQVSGNQGLLLSTSTQGLLMVKAASSTALKTGQDMYAPTVPGHQHESAFYGLAKAAGDTTQSASSNAVGNYTETARSKIHDMLDAPVTVSGSTPSITALPGVRYVCGECSTLDITVPASGDVEIIFDSGSTATVLTVTPPTGVTAVKWANGFDPTALDADTRYDLIITDGEWGLAASWAV